MRPTVGAEYLLITPAGLGARVIVKTVAANDALITIDVYTPSPEAGALLYKKGS